jgi:hypothetical protein
MLATTLAATRRLLARTGLTRRASPLLVTLIAALGWTALVGVVARTRYGSDVRALLIIGEQTQLPRAFATIPTAGPTGYDGAMYAALATDPLLRWLDTPHDLDSPSYRATRIMVPLLAWVLALGHAPAAIVLYQLLCWGLAIGAVYFLARWLADEDRSPWWALAAAGGAGMAAAIIRSVPDAAALCFMLAALWLHARGRPPLALGFAVAAVLTRETSILAALAIAADELRRRRLGTAAAFAALPAAAAAGWQLHLRHVLGAAFDTGIGNFALPFAWLPHKCAVIVQGGIWGIWWEEVFGTVAVVATVIAFVAVVSRPSRWCAAELTFLAFAGMGLFLGANVYCETWAYARALIPVPFLAALIGERQAVPWRRWALRLVVLLYLVAGITMIHAEVRDALGPRTLPAALWQGTAFARPSVGTFARATDAGPVLTPQAPLWVVPAANTGGRAGALWRTQLAIKNPDPRPVRVALELFGPSDGGAPGTVVTLAPHETREWDDAFQELFGRSGLGAIRLVAEGRQVAAGSLTANVAVAAPIGPLLPALREDRAVRTGGRASFAGLAYDPVHDAGVRTNIGVFNLASTPVTVCVAAFDGRSRPLGKAEDEVAPRSFTQIDDIFARLRAPRLEDGHAVVSSPTSGAALLVYASVIRGPTAQAVYLYPQPEPETPR